MGNPTSIYRGMGICLWTGLTYEIKNVYQKSSKTVQSLINTGRLVSIAKFVATNWVRIVGTLKNTNLEIGYALNLAVFTLARTVACIIPTRLYYFERRTGRNKGQYRQSH